MARSPQTQGVIVKVNKDSFEVLENTGTKHIYQLQNIGQKRFSKNLMSTDAENQPVGTGDLVRILDGPYKVRLEEIVEPMQHFLLFLRTSKAL